MKKMEYIHSEAFNKTLGFKLHSKFIEKFHMGISALKIDKVANYIIRFIRMKIFNY